MDRTPWIQHSIAFVMMMPPAPSGGWIVMFSMPALLMTVVGHQACGDCEERQFGMWRPGEIVTWFPLMAMTLTICRWLRYPPGAVRIPSLPSPAQTFATPQL